MFKGGYKIIDFKNAPISNGGNPVEIPGIYNAIKESHGKPLMLAGVKVDGVGYGATYGIAVEGFNSYNIKAYGYVEGFVIAVSSDDTVSISLG